MNPIREPAPRRATPLPALIFALGWDRLRAGWRARPRLELEAMPAMAAALWFLAGLLGPGLAGLQLASPLAATVAVAVWGAVLWLFLTPSGRRQAWLLPVGVGWVALHLWAPWQTLERHLPLPEMGVTVEGIVLDPTRATAASPAVPAAPAGVPLAVRRLRAADGGWIPCRATVLLRLPPGGAALPYGSAVRATGALLTPAAPSFPGEFNYRATLRARGIRHQLQAVTVTPTAPATGWRRAFASLFLARDVVLRHATRQLTPEGATFVSGVLFGGNNLLDHERRDQFANSGTIHIFSVSGLHVALLATLLNGLLRLTHLPFRWRHALLPPLLLPYVLMTGGDPAAIRAWVMVSVWAAARASLRPSQPLNTLALAALIVLAGNPLNLFRTGFQFSFTLVFFLILGWPVIRQLRQGLVADEWLRPGHGHAHSRWCLPTLCAPPMLLAAALAAAAALAPTAWLNQRFIPGSVVTNMGIGLCAAAAMTLGGLKLLLAPLVALGVLLPDRWLAALLNASSTVTLLLADLGSRAPASLAIPRPPFLLALVHSLALAATLAWTGRARWAAAVATGGATLLILSGSLADRSPPPRLLLLTGDGAATPAVLWQPIAQRPPIAVIPGNLRLARSLEERLTDEGITELDLLLQTGPLPPDTAQGFATQCELRGLAGGRRPPRLAPGVWPLPGVEAAVPPPYGPWDVQRRIDGTRTVWRVECALPDGPASLTLDADAAGGRCRLALCQPGRAPLRLDLPRSLPLVWRTVP